mmetsp:Transcript_25729/g.59683  ORF Transcript_25729/g.59683 Transcript_25729/m.59683 type:complete len:284 (-) Transcript_25729:1075-1926(-)
MSSARAKAEHAAGRHRLHEPPAHPGALRVECPPVGEDLRADEVYIAVGDKRVGSDGSRAPPDVPLDPGEETRSLGVIEIFGKLAHSALGNVNAPLHLLIATLLVLFVSLKVIEELALSDGKRGQVQPSLLIPLGIIHQHWAAAARPLARHPRCYHMLPVVVVLEPRHAVGHDPAEGHVDKRDPALRAVAARNRAKHPIGSQSTKVEVGWGDGNALEELCHLVGDVEVKVSPKAMFVDLPHQHSLRRQCLPLVPVRKVVGRVALGERGGDSQDLPVHVSSVYPL